jgi:DNA modification methylase
MTITLLQGDCLEILATLPPASVQCVVTSPPYWGLRDYGVEGQLGLERTPEEYVAKLVAVFREVRRVLRDDGTLWLNLGDSYATHASGSKSHPHNFRTAEIAAENGIGTINKPTAVSFGMKEKDLVGIPWRVAFALQADGWYLRSDIIWHKPNPMPESVTDRPTKSHEYIFLLTKSARYFYDNEAVKEPANQAEMEYRNKIRSGKNYDVAGPHATNFPMAYSDTSSRNRRSVWTVATTPYKEAHFATYPPKLIEPCILAGTSERGACPVCGAPWVRVVDSGKTIRVREGSNTSGDRKIVLASGQSGGIFTTGEKKVYTTIGWRPTCNHEAEPVPCVVLDPFNGAGTTGLVTLQNGRDYIGIELNPEYIKLTEKRLMNIQPKITLALEAANA